MAAQGARPRGQTRKTQAERGGSSAADKTATRKIAATEGNSFGFAATFRLHCGRKQLPQALRRQLPHEGAWGSYCQCSALRQENFGRKKLPDYMDLVVTGSLARELPKAEGVARGRRKSPDYMSLAVYGSLARELPKAEGVARGRRKSPDYMDLAVTGSLARELPKAEGVAHKHAAIPHVAHPHGQIREA